MASVGVIPQSTTLGILSRGRKASATLTTVATPYTGDETLAVPGMTSKTVTEMGGASGIAAYVTANSSCDCTMSGTSITLTAKTAGRSLNGSIAKGTLLAATVSLDNGEDSVGTAAPLTLGSATEHHLLRLRGATTDAAVEFTESNDGALTGVVDNVFGWEFNGDGAATDQPILARKTESRWCGTALPGGLMEDHFIFTSLDRELTFRPWTWSMNLNTNVWSLQISRFDKLYVLNADEAHALDIDATALTVTLPTLIATSRIQSPQYTSASGLAGGGQPTSFYYKIGSATVLPGFSVDPDDDDPVGSGTGIQLRTPAGFETGPIPGAQIYTLCGTSQTYQTVRMTFCTLDAAGAFLDTFTLRNGYAGFGSAAIEPGKEWYNGCVEVRYPSALWSAGARGQFFVLDSSTSQAADVGGRIDLGGWRAESSNRVFTYASIKGAAVGATGDDGYLAFAVRDPYGALTEVARFTSTGVLRVPSLAGTGSRAVVVDANGNMSAP